MATRWGILSTGKIAYDFTSVLVCHDPEEHQVVAVAARSKGKAKSFAETFGIKTTYGSYDELVNDPNVDIVYIASIHPEHYKLSMLCLNAGKNVLCEKPFTMTLAAATEIFSLAKEKKLFVMEGFWTCCFPMFRHLHRELEENTIGEVKMLSVKFFVKIPPQWGATYDIGCYTIMFADFVFKEKPEKISVQGQVADNGVDTGAAVTLTYSGGRIANLIYSTLATGNDNTATIVGTKGCINVENGFFNPTKITTPLGKYEFPVPACRNTTFKFGDQSRGFVYEQNCVRDCLKKGLLEYPLMTHGNSLNIMYIIETILKELGVTYMNDYPYTV